jgi:chromosome segregation ATPase
MQTDRPAHNPRGPTMTTEERFTKIENTLSTITENQAKHESAIRDLVVVSRTFLDSQKETTKQMQELRQAQQQTDREWREAQQESDRKWREADRRLDETLNSITEKLNALIDLVDQIIRKRNDKS